jgi:5'-phosphate synthase pdxT subunit
MVGVLALQGDFREHLAALDACGALATVVRTADELAAVDALVIPGGESTTQGLLLRRFGLEEALTARLGEGLPCLATCAGAILLARDILDGRPGQLALGTIDMSIRRNGYGRQADSFMADIDISGAGPVHAAFIRAPVIEATGPEVEVLAQLDGHPVVVRHGQVIAATFHPEITGDTGLHRLFLQGVS